MSFDFILIIQRKDARTYGLNEVSNEGQVDQMRYSISRKSSCEYLYHVTFFNMTSSFTMIDSKKHIFIIEK